MVEPFKEKLLKEQTTIERLVGKQPEENAINEINNLLSKAQNIKQISIQDINRIANIYKVNLVKKFHKNLEILYQEYLHHCLKDKALSEEEISNSAHLKSILGLNDSTVEKIHNEVAESTYNKSFEEAISDGRLEPNEREFLQRLQQDLKLSDEYARKIYSEKANKYMDDYIKSSISDERLSPDEEKEIIAIASSLGIDLKYEEKTKQLFDKYRLFWLIENGEVPIVEVDINLQRNERCYFKTNVDWLEHRKITRRVGYSGPHLRIGIFRGLSWRMGNFAVKTYSEDVLSHIDSGPIYLTNKRLIFTGNYKNTTIALNKILDVEPYQNGVVIQKGSGKSPFLKFNENIDIFCLVLSRAIRDLG